MSLRSSLEFQVQLDYKWLAHLKKNDIVDKSTILKTCFSM
jgi:hypothetical protein